MAAAESSGNDEKDIWTLALQTRHAAAAHADEEKTLLFVGSKSGGKTTIINRFLEKTVDVKQTTALEYTYGRKARSQDMVKDVVHLWELGGGSFLSKLVETPITPTCLRFVSVVMAIDLSKPEEMFATLDPLLKTIRQRIDRVMSDLKNKDSRLPDHLKKKSWRKYGESHPDRDMINPLPVPFIILGTKYDIFQDLDPENRKVICKTLRFIAHTNGASLLFLSSKDEGSMNRCRSVLSYLAFKTEAPSRAVEINHSKPLIVPVGSDSLSQIGAPPLGEDNLTSISAKSPMDLWRLGFERFFPANDSKNAKESKAEKKAFPEAVVDSMRSQKDEELERYRKQAERRARDLNAKSHSRASRGKSASKSSSSSGHRKHRSSKAEK